VQNYKEPKAFQSTTPQAKDIGKGFMGLSGRATAETKEPSLSCGYSLLLPSLPPLPLLPWGGGSQFTSSLLGIP
jgi:hypothetical protein